MYQTNVLPILSINQVFLVIARWPAPPRLMSPQVTLNLRITANAWLSGYHLRSPFSFRGQSIIIFTRLLEEKIEQSSTAWEQLCNSLYYTKIENVAPHTATSPSLPSPNRNFQNYLYSLTQSCEYANGIKLRFRWFSYIALKLLTYNNDTNCLLLSAQNCPIRSNSIIYLSE